MIVITFCILALSAYMVRFWELRRAWVWSLGWGRGDAGVRGG